MLGLDRPQSIKTEAPKMKHFNIEFAVKNTNDGFAVTWHLNQDGELIEAGRSDHVSRGEAIDNAMITIQSHILRMSRTGAPRPHR